MRSFNLGEIEKRFWVFLYSNLLPRGESRMSSTQINKEMKRKSERGVWGSVERGVHVVCPGAVSGGC